MPNFAPYQLKGIISSDAAAYWDTVVAQSGTELTAVDPGLLHLSIVTLQFTRTEPTGAGDDVGSFSLYMGLDPGTGSAMNPLTDTEAASVETILDTLWTTIKPKITSHWVHSGYVWRHTGADGPRGKTGRIKPTPAWRVTSRSAAGTGGTSTHPDQVAETVTFITPSRRHWGRVYLPAFAEGFNDQYGRILSSTVDTVAGAFHTAFASMVALTVPVVPLVWNSLNPGALCIWKLSMDDVYDVIRKRRPKHATYHKVYTS